MSDVLWRCPACGSTNLDVQVSVWAKLTQTPEKDENEFETDVDAARDHDHEWDGDSPMNCRDCDHDAPASDFMVVPERKVEVRP